MSIGTRVESKATYFRGTIVDSNTLGVCVRWDGSPWTRDWKLIKELRAI